MRSLLLTLALTLAACGSTTSDPPASTTPGADTGTTAAAQKFRTHLILGDSISDGGGEAPYFYTLLSQELGSDVKVVKASKGGARAQNLGGQIATVTGPLESPVLVTITIGGNDVTAALGKILTGGDDTMERNDFKEFLTAAIAELTKADRFGAGVKVAIYMTNVYDPSDGTGNFKFQSGTKCPGALGFYPAGKPTAPQLDPWEQIFTEVAAGKPDVHVLDLRAKYQGHGVPAAEPWFVPDCIHPNAKGHAAIKELFAAALPK
jgi:lysophospholipase L1-like esterase